MGADRNATLKIVVIDAVDNLKNGRACSALLSDFLQNENNLPRKAFAKSVKLGFRDAIPKPAPKPVKVGSKSERS